MLTLALWNFALHKQWTSIFDSNRYAPDIVYCCYLQEQRVLFNMPRAGKLPRGQGSCSTGTLHHLRCRRPRRKGLDFISIALLLLDCLRIDVACYQLSAGACEPGVTASAMNMPALMRNCRTTQSLLSCHCLLTTHRLLALLPSTVNARLLQLRSALTAAMHGHRAHTHTHSITMLEL